MTVYVVMKTHGFTLEWVPVKVFSDEQEANKYVSRQLNPWDYSMSEVDYVE